MSSRLLLGATFVVFVAVLAAAYFTLPKTSVVLVTQPAAVTESTGTTTASGYTMAMVAAHNSAAGCWAAINGNVYDLTQWINQHPGGPEHILAICGTDGSASFNGQHSGDTQPQQELKNFLLGPLAQ